MGSPPIGRGAFCLANSVATPLELLSKSRPSRTRSKAEYSVTADTYDFRERIFRYQNRNDSKNSSQSIPLKRAHTTA
nr:hypothetical protein Hi04_10k_c4921_00012 [uncultured bacterium]